MHSTRERQWRYAQVAGEVMSCLVKHHSNVDFIDFGSFWEDCYDSKTDDNGHAWPNYSYRRGSVVLDMQQHPYVVKTIVVPIPVPAGSTQLLTEI